jgi:hypothetical protein
MTIVGYDAVCAYLYVGASEEQTYQYVLTTL